MSELLQNPRPPEVDPERLEARIALLRVGMPKLSPAAYVGARNPNWEDSRNDDRERKRDRQEAAELARLEVELALLRRLGPPKRRRRGGAKKGY
jgi:hypothetical protein